MTCTIQNYYNQNWIKHHQHVCIFHGIRCPSLHMFVSVNCNPYWNNLLARSVQGFWVVMCQLLWGPLGMVFMAANLCKVPPTSHKMCSIVKYRIRQHIFEHPLCYQWFRQVEINLGTCISNIISEMQHFIADLQHFSLALNSLNSLRPSDAYMRR